VLRCPPDAEPETVLSVLTQKLGEVTETPCTSTEHDKRLGIGWIFPGTPATGLQETAELACMPFIELPGGLLQFMDEVQAEQCMQFAQLAAGHGLDIPRNTIFRLLALPIRECSAVGRQVTMPTAVDLNFWLSQYKPSSRELARVSRRSFLHAQTTNSNLWKRRPRRTC
jgi:hypothetical protein